MKNVLTGLLVIIISLSCSDSKKEDGNGNHEKEKKETSSPKGIGEIKNVVLNDPLDESMIQRGLGIYDMKCSACHKLTDRRVVGPGFLGVTERRQPEWIMNMITNVDVMLDKDPEARKLFEECLTRMPNQNVSIGDARDVLEFFLNNDSQSPSK